MSDLIRQMAGISPPPRKQQTSFLRPVGSPVHYTDGTVMPEADSNMYEAFQNAYEKSLNREQPQRQYRPEALPEEPMRRYRPEPLPDMGAQIQPPDLAPPMQPVQPSAYANMPIEQGQPTVASQNAWGQENYGHMMAQRRAAYEAQMAQRRAGR